MTFSKIISMLNIFGDFMISILLVWSKMCRYTHIWCIDVIAWYKCTCLRMSTHVWSRIMYRISSSRWCGDGYRWICMYVYVCIWIYVLMCMCMCMCMVCVHVEHTIYDWCYSIYDSWYHIIHHRIRSCMKWCLWCIDSIKSCKNRKTRHMYDLWQKSTICYDISFYSMSVAPRS